MADVVAASDLRQGLALIFARPCFLLLVVSEFRCTPELNAARLRSRASLSGAAAYQVAFELRKPAEDSEHQAAVGRRRVRPCIAEGSESRFPAGDGCKRVEKIAGTAGEPVEPGYEQHVAVIERVQKSLELCPVGLGSARYFLIYALRSGIGQGRDLRRDALAFRRYPCVAINHRVIMHIYSAQESAN